MNMGMNFLGEAAIKQVLKYVSRNPDKNLPALVDFAEKLPLTPGTKELLRQAREVMQDKKNNWYRLAVRIFKELSVTVLERLVINFLLNGWLAGRPLVNNIPFALLVDPTARCNLSCTGDCSRGREPAPAELKRLCKEFRDLGVYFVVISGGEPLLHRDDLMELAASYNDMVFHVFTNGLLIDRTLAVEASRLGNIVFAVSLEGHEQTTDLRRGAGVYRRVVQAMDILHREGVLFGFSAAYYRHNTGEVGSEEFIDLMVARGCIFGWYFPYTPVEAGADPDMTALPEQHAFIRRQVKRFRETKPIAVFDFGNDQTGAQ